MGQRGEAEALASLCFREHLKCWAPRAVGVGPPQTMGPLLVLLEVLPAISTLLHSSRTSPPVLSFRTGSQPAFPRCACCRVRCEPNFSILYKGIDGISGAADGRCGG